MINKVSSSGISRTPAEVFWMSLRLSDRPRWTHPEVARFITGRRASTSWSYRVGIRPRLRDIEARASRGSVERR